MDTETSSTTADNAKKLAQTVLAIACNVAFSILPAIKTPIARIGFGFIPVMFTAAILPLPLVILVMAVQDVISYFLFNMASGPFNPGITLSAVAAGVIWSFAFSDVRKGGAFDLKKVTLRMVIASAAVAIVCNLLINTTALSIQLGKAWIPLLLPRIWSSVVLFVIHIPVGVAIAKLVAKRNNA
jgi:ECF transporter S component (folate family)